MSPFMRKMDIRIDKGADQPCSNYMADQRPCFRYTDSTIPRLPKCKTSVAAEAGLCQTWSDPPPPPLPLESWLIYYVTSVNVYLFIQSLC